MNSLWLAFLGSFILGLILVPAAIAAASRLEVVATTDFRRKNYSRVPLWGGLALYTSCLVTSFFLDNIAVLTLCLCALPIVISGVLDDLRELGSKPKFFAQVLSTGLFLYLHPAGGLILEQLGLNFWISYTLTAFWIVGMINAFNFIDGMDGVAGGIALIAGLTLAFMNQHGSMMEMGLLIAGSSLAFLFFNLPNAKIYLGDAGSTFLGFALAAMAVQTPMRHVHNLWIAAPMFVLAYPQIDAVLAIRRRLLLGLSLFKGDHDHIHHLLQKVGFNTKQALLAIYAVGIYCSLTAICLFYTANVKFALAILFLTASALLAVLACVYFIQLRLAQQVSHYSQSLIHKHFNAHGPVCYDPERFTAIVFDLLPYYKELQQRGILIVDRFISAFSRVIEKRCSQGQVVTLGSYSVILIFPPGQIKNKGLKTRIINDFQSLLEEFQVVRNISEIPEGIQLFSHEQNSRDFQLLVDRNYKKEAPALRMSA